MGSIVVLSSHRPHQVRLASLVEARPPVNLGNKTLTKTITTIISNKIPINTNRIFLEIPLLGGGIIEALPSPVSGDGGVVNTGAGAGGICCASPGAGASGVCEINGGTVGAGSVDK